MGKTIKHLRPSLSKADGWNLKNHGHLPVARHHRAKTHAHFLVVTLREGEERGICSAALKELVEIIRDQAEERSVLVLVLNRESAVWNDSSMKALLRHVQLENIDVDGTRVVTNNRCVEEQFKSDNVENVATVGVKMRKVGPSEKIKSIVMGGINIGKNCWNSGEFQKLTRKGKFRMKRNCAS